MHVYRGGLGGGGYVCGSVMRVNVCMHFFLNFFF